MRIEVDIDDDEMKVLAETTIKALIEERMRKHVESVWNTWSTKQDINLEIRAAMKEKAKEAVNQIMSDHKAIQARAEQAVFNSISQRVHAATKRLEGEK